MKFPPYPMTGIVEYFGRRFRPFTLFPRRFSTHYWDNKHCLNFTKWWQWGRRCFLIRNRIILRPLFSDWTHINSRMAAGDLDASMIQQCIFTLQTHPNYRNQSPEKIYNRMVNFARS